MTDVKKKRLKKWTVGMIGLFLAGIFYTLWVFETGVGIPCPFYWKTGWYCPGCGITRCILYLLQFQFQKAFESNMLVFCTLPLFFYFFAVSMYRYIQTGKISYKKWEERSMAVLIGCFLTFGVLRNCPGMEWMRPPVF